MRLSLFFFLLTMVCSTVHAQDVVFSENVSDTTQKRKGPNLNVFKQAWVQVGFYTPFENNHRQQYPGSYHLGIGHRVKYKINNTFSWGWIVAFHFNHYRLDSVFVLPKYQSNEVRKEKFLQRQFAGELFFRTNVGKRGNYLGNFFDIGVSAGVNVSNSFRYRIREKDVMGNTIAETTVNIRKTGKALPYFYGVAARFGINKWILFGEFRLSDVFGRDARLPELSPLRLGVQMSL